MYALRLPLHWLKSLPIRLQLKKIGQLIDMFANEAVDVLGVVDTVADSALIQTRDGKDVSTHTLQS